MFYYIFKLVYTVASIDTQCIDSNLLESGRYISRVGWASRFLSLPPLGASVHQMPFYLRMYLNLLIGRVVHVTSDRLHEQQISRRRPPEMNIRKHLCWIVLIVFRKVRQFPHVNCLIDLISVNLPTTGSAMHFSHFVFVISFWP